MTIDYQIVNNYAGVPGCRSSGILVARPIIASLLRCPQGPVEPWYSLQGHGHHLVDDFLYLGVRIYSQSGSLKGSHAHDARSRASFLIAFALRSASVLTMNVHINDRVMDER